MRPRPAVVAAGLGLAGLLGACGTTATPKTAATPSTSAASTNAASSVAAGTTVAPAPASPAATTKVTAASTLAPSTQPPAGVSTTVAGPEVAVAGDIPDNQAFVSYTPPAGGYSVKVPEGWARSADGTATVFSDKSNSIRIDTGKLPAAPTVASVTSADLPAISSASKGYAAGKVSLVKRKAGEAVLATYQIDGGSNGVTTKTVRLDVERYVFWKNGTEVTLTLSAAKGSDNVDPWKTVTDGFVWA